MKFTASLDRFAKIATMIVILSIGVVGGLAIGNNHPILFPFLIPAILLILLVIAYGFAPTYYLVTDTAVVVKALFRSYTYPKSEIVAYRKLNDDEMKWTIRTFGVGGLFGYYGKFYNSKVGSMTWYATQRKKQVLFTTTTGKNIVLTPDEPDAFLQALTS